MVGQQVLHPLGLVHIGQVDESLDLGQGLEAGLCGPPFAPQIPDPLLWRRQHHAIGAADDRPALLQIEIGEGRRLLVLPYVFGHDRHAIAEVVGEIRKDKARVGRLELDPRRQIIERDGLLDPGLHVRAEQQIRRVGLEHIDGEDEVAHRPGSSVAPLDAGADLHRHFRVVRVVFVPGGDPGNDIVFLFEGVVEVERLVEEVPAGGCGIARYIGVEGIVVLDLPSADRKGQAVEDHRALARHLFQARARRIRPAAGKERGQGREQ